MASCVLQGGPRDGEVIETELESVRMTCGSDTLDEALYVRTDEVCNGMTVYRLPESTPAFAQVPERRSCE